MTPQELKASVLLYALQGRLVSHDPAEGTGRDEIEKMLRHKERLQKNKEIKKEKPIPPVTDNEITTDIPDNWCWERIGNIGSWSAGATPPRTNPDFYGGNIPWLKTGDLNDGIVSSVPEYITDLALQKTSVRLNPIGSVLMAMYGATIGKLGILDAPMTTNQACCACIPYEGMFNKYLFYFLMGNRLNFIKMGEGGAQPNISKEKIVNFPIAVPPLAEQRRIVAKLEEILPLIDRYEAAWNQLEAFNKRFPGDMQKSILQFAIQGKLVEQCPEEGTGEELFQQIQAEKQALIKAGKIKKEKSLPEISDDEIPFDIPDTWKWTRIAAITTLNPKNDLEDDLETAFIPMPCVMDGFRNQHTFEVKRWKEIKKGFTHFANGDIGVAKITPCFQNRKSVVFHDLKNGYGAGTTELTIVRTIGETVLREYLLWFFKTDYFISNGVKSFTGTAGQQRIHKDYLATCLIPLPPLDEQKRIVAKLEEILPLCDRLK